MSIVTLRLPEVKRETGTRPGKCPYCKGTIMQGWGEVKKPVRDPRIRNVSVCRYHCCHCRRTFRHYPEGVDRADQTLRLRKLAALCWMLGLSYRGIATVFEAFGVTISHMSAWRDAQEMAQALKRSKRWKSVRVMGLDGAYVRGMGKTNPVLIAVDLGTGKPVEIGYVNERDPQAVRKWLEPIVKRLGVSVIVSDDLKAFQIVAEQLGLEHQVCQFHVRRWAGRDLKQLRETVPKEYLWVVEETKQLIDELPQDGSRRLFELWKEVKVRRKGRDALTPVDQLRNLLIRLSENWDRYCTFYWQNQVPWTNNGSEQVIGKMKIRSKSVRGYKSEQGMLNGLMLAGSGIW